MGEDEKKKKECKDVDICNQLMPEVSLTDIKIKDNGDYLCIVNGDKVHETGFTSHNAEIFLNNML